jgi:AcrR family transcriptional regulator
MSTSPEPPPYHHGDLRRALIEAAMTALREKGAESIGLREVARRVGVSAAAPYRHFESREALLAAVATEGFEAFRRAQDEAQEGIAENDQFAAMAHAYVRFALANPQLFRLMFSAGLDMRQYPELRAAADAAYAPLARAAAREDNIAPEEVAVAAWAFVHGLSVLLLDNQILGASPANSDGLVKSLTARFIAGMRAARLG